jgi:hypothetical protein
MSPELEPTLKLMSTVDSVRDAYRISEANADKVVRGALGCDAVRALRKLSLESER